MELTRERVPLQWATTQYNIGSALATLGLREAGMARLAEAVVAYDACLTVVEPVQQSKGTVQGEATRFSP